MQAAASDYGKAIELRPDAANVYLARASALFQLGDYPAALADVGRRHRARAELGRRLQPARPDRRGAGRRSTRRSPTSPRRSRSIPGSPTPTATAARSRPSAAISTPPIADFNLAIERAPDLAPAYLARADALAKKNDDRAALRDLDTAIQLDPDNPVAYVARGNVRVRQGNAAPAIADFSKAIALRPTLAAAYYGRGRAYMLDEKLRPGAGGLRAGAPARPEDGGRPGSSWRMWPASRPRQAEQSG